MFLRTCHMARSCYWLVALIQLLITAAQVNAVDVDVSEALVLQPGDDALLQCNYTTTQSASSGSLTWSFNNGSSDVTFYQRQGSTESIPSTDYQSRVTFVGDMSNGIANILISDMQNEDSRSYKCSVTVFLDGSDSQSITVTVIEPTTVTPTTGAPPTTTHMPTFPPVDNPILLWVVIIFECQALWAAILMIAILSLVSDDVCCWTFCVCTDDCCCCLTCTCGAVNLMACIGPLVGVVIAVVVIILAILPPNSGTVYQLGFTLIVVSSGAAAGMSICAAIDGFLFKYFGNGVKFPVATMSLEFSLGLMVAIAGTVMSAVYELGIAGIVIGAICIVLLVVAFIWFMCRVWCGKKQSSKVSQDFSETRSHNQIELGHHQAEESNSPVQFH